jgi:hypothetical protein
MLDGDALSRRDPGINGKPDLLAGERKVVGHLRRNDAVLQIEDHSLVTQQGGDLAGWQVGIFQPESEHRSAGLRAG